MGCSPSPSIHHLISTLSLPLSWSQFFPACSNNPAEGWYPGTISGHFYAQEAQNGGSHKSKKKREECDLMNIVHYDDGDKETVFNANLRDEKTVRMLQNSSIKRQLTSDVPESTVSSHRSKKIKLEPVSVSSCSDEDDSSEREPKKEPDQVKSEPKIKVEEESNVSHTEADSIPEAIGSRWSPDQLTSNVLMTANQDAAVKVEGAATHLSPEERQKRQEAFDKWRHANTDPRTGLGRYVFRRGCHSSCLTTILGGHGMDPWPIVKKVPEVDDQPNPFIQAGQFYVAGNEAWNPFGPRFPGDTGLVNTEALVGNPAQKEFHMFVECSKQPCKRHWHGKLAAAGRMYVGVYRVPEDDDIEMVIEYAKDEHIAWENKFSIAHYFVKKDYKDFSGKLAPDIPECCKTRAESIAVGDWNTMTQEKKDTWIMVAYLIDTNQVFHVKPIEFVRFDENLYQTLVDHGCATCRNGERGSVALDAAALHQYF
jgi:hypothetical protein